MKIFPEFWFNNVRVIPALNRPPMHKKITFNPIAELAKALLIVDGICEALVNFCIFMKDIEYQYEEWS